MTCIVLLLVDFECCKKTLWCRWTQTYPIHLATNHIRSIQVGIPVQEHQWDSA